MIQTIIAALLMFTGTCQADDLDRFFKADYSFVAMDKETFDRERFELTAPHSKYPSGARKRIKALARHMADIALATRLITPAIGDSSQTTYRTAESRDPYHLKYKMETLLKAANEQIHFIAISRTSIGYRFLRSDFSSLSSYTLSAASMFSPIIMMLLGGINPEKLTVTPEAFPVFVATVATFVVSTPLAVASFLERDRYEHSSRYHDAPKTSIELDFRKAFYKFFIAEIERRAPELELPDWMKHPPSNISCEILLGGLTPPRVRVEEKIKKRVAIDSNLDEPEQLETQTKAQMRLRN